MEKHYQISKVVKTEERQGPLGFYYRLHFKDIIGCILCVEDELMDKYPDMRTEDPDYQLLVGRDYIIEVED